MFSKFSTEIIVCLLIIVVPVTVVLLGSAAVYFIGLFAVLPIMGTLGMMVLLSTSAYLAFDVIR